MIDEKSIEAAARSHHLATVAIVEKMIGDNTFATDVFPAVVAHGGKLNAVVIGSSNKTPNSDYLNSYIIIGAFSLELKLKLLYFIENKKTIVGHDLIAIYEKLSKDSKKKIQSFVTNLTSNSARHKQIEEVINSLCNNNFTWDVKKLIRNSSRAFEKWRYSFENKGVLPWFAGYNELQKAFDARIEEIRNQKST